MRECEAYLCHAPAKHYTANPSTQRNLHLCYAHNEMHRQGIAFVVDPLNTDQPSVGVLTPDPVDAILELITPAAPATLSQPKEANMAYGILSTLTDARDELSNGIDEARNRISELEDAINDMEGALDSVREAIDALENIDGFSASVDIEALAVDVYINL